MNLKAICIKNFRRLENAHIELTPQTSIFVGANNSGKTSATHILQLFLSSSYKEKLTIYDFSADCWEKFNAIGLTEYSEGFEELSLPSITLDLWFDVKPDDLHRVIDLLPSLDWNGTPVGVRLEFSAKSPHELLKNFKEAKKKAALGKSENFHPWPESLVDYLEKHLKHTYEIHYYVLDHEKFNKDFQQQEDYSPLRLGDDKERTGAKILKSLIKVDLLNAQRHLSDTGSAGRAEDLSKCLNRFYERNLQKVDNDIEAMKALTGSQNQLSNHLTKVFAPTLKSLNKLGYPGFADPHLVIKAALNPESIMNQNAKLHYALSANPSSFTLPDKYNGLGFKNLIYMVVELLGFHARWVDEEEDRALLHLIIIEEPEAHLHIQLQQVFIRKILDVLKDSSPEDDNFTNQLIITTHSSHIIYESGFMPIRYFRRCVGLPKSTVLNLSKFYKGTETETRDFLQSYMKFTHCDLFFADAAILVEGNVERLLLPIMIEKCANKLKSSYLSILEVGGAFAYRFKELIKFLGIPTLIITDLDSVLSHSGGLLPENAEEEEADENSLEGKSCMVNTPNAVTSNQTLIQWLPKLEKVSELLAATADKKIQVGTKDCPALIRIAYQTQQQVSWKGQTNLAAGRTLEEAFALENLTLCQDSKQKSLGLRIPKNDQISLEELHEKIYRRVKSDSFNKTNFALNLMMINLESWKVPAYIEEGLLWLIDQTIDTKTPLLTAEEKKD